MKQISIHWANAQSTRGSLLLILALAGWLLLAVPAMAQEKYDADRAGGGSGINAADREELERISDDLQDVISMLAAEGALSSEETYSLQRELALIQRDLDALRDRLEHGTGSSGDGQGAGDWQSYPYFKRDTWPSGRTFKSWHEFADVNFDFGEYGEIVLSIDNFDYATEITIQDAYNGRASVDTRTTNNGDVQLSVRDDEGEHEFLVQQGGLGELFIRGRKGYSPPPTKAVSPVDGADSGKWYGAYRELVRAGQLGESGAMEWYIAQYDSGDYVTPQLQVLGQLLGGLHGAGTAERLGTIVYTVNGKQKTMEVADPRLSPGLFVTLMTKVKQLSDAGAPFRFDWD
jgi:hypothetical protein